MAELKEIFIRTLAERVAVELIKGGGRNWTAQPVASRTADALRDFTDEDVKTLMRLTASYVEAAAVMSTPPPGD